MLCAAEWDRPCQLPTASNDLCRNLETWSSIDVQTCNLTNNNLNQAFLRRDHEMGSSLLLGR